MKLNVLVSGFALLTTTVIAFKSYETECLCQEEADQIVTRFIGILDHKGSDLGSPNVTAQALIADGYQEISDSILSLESAPLGGDSASGKEQTIAGLLFAPADRNITTINVFVAGCTHVLWQWLFNDIGTGQYEVKGFNLFDITSARQIQTSYIEFNTIAWGIDTFVVQYVPSNATNGTSRTVR